MEDLNLEVFELSLYEFICSHCQTTFWYDIIGKVDYPRYCPQCASPAPREASRHLRLMAISLPAKNK